MSDFCRDEKLVAADSVIKKDPWNFDAYPPGIFWLWMLYAINACGAVRVIVHSPIGRNLLMPRNIKEKKVEMWRGSFTSLIMGNVVSAWLITPGFYDMVKWSQEDKNIDVFSDYYPPCDVWKAVGWWVGYFVYDLIALVWYKQLNLRNGMPYNLWRDYVVHHCAGILFPPFVMMTRRGPALVTWMQMFEWSALLANLRVLMDLHQFVWLTTIVSFMLFAAFFMVRVAPIPLVVYEAARQDRKFPNGDDKPSLRTWSWFHFVSSGITFIWFTQLSLKWFFQMWKILMKYLGGKERLTGRGTGGEVVNMAKEEAEVHGCFASEVKVPVQMESANMASSSSSSDEGTDGDDFDNYGGGFSGNKIVPVDEHSLKINDKEYIAQLRRDLTFSAREEWMRALGQEHFPLK